MTLAVLPALTQGLFFDMTPEAERCFTEIVGEDTKMVVEYENPDFVPFGRPGFTGVGVRAVVTDPSYSPILDTVLDNHGRLTFTTFHGGEYQVCVSLNSSRNYNEPLKVQVKFDIGEMAIDYTEIAKKDHLDNLSLEVRKLRDKLNDIHQNQEYQKERENQFRETMNATNSRVSWWSFAQTAVLVVAAVWQLVHLKNFFLAKKLA